MAPLAAAAAVPASSAARCGQDPLFSHTMVACVAGGQPKLHHRHSTSHAAELGACVQLGHLARECPNGKRGGKGPPGGGGGGGTANINGNGSMLALKVLLLSLRRVMFLASEPCGYSMHGGHLYTDDV